MPGYTGSKDDYLKRLRRIAHVVREDASSSHEALDVLRLEVFHHRVPDLPDAKWQGTFLGPDTYCGEAVEILLPGLC